MIATRSGRGGEAKNTQNGGKKHTHTHTHHCGTAAYDAVALAACRDWFVSVSVLGWWVARARVTN